METYKPKVISILVVVVNYFSHKLVDSLLNDLARQAQSREITLKVVCADNSSNEREHNALVKIQQENSLEFDLLRQTDNVGFGRAVNDASKGRQFDFLWLINPDIDLFENTLDELIKPIIEFENGIVGGLTISKNFKPDYRHAWHEPTLINTIGWAFGIKKISANPLWHDSYRHNLQVDDLPYKVDNISGCCMLISHEVWRATQGFDEDFFLYSEEIDLCRRARSLGYQPYVAPRARLRHSAHSNDVGLTRLPLIYSSKLIYADKHRSTSSRVIYRGVIVAGALLRSIVGLLQGKNDRAHVWWDVAVNSCFAKRFHQEESVQ